MTHNEFWARKFIFDVRLMISLSSHLQIQYGGGNHLENRLLNSLVPSAVWLMAYGMSWVEEVFFNVILIAKFSFELQLQDGCHLENICGFDLFPIIIGASLIFTEILFKWINDSNDDDNDITYSRGSTTTTITIAKFWNYSSKLQRLHHWILGMDE